MAVDEMVLSRETIIMGGHARKSTGFRTLDRHLKGKAKSFSQGTENIARGFNSRKEL